MKFFRLAAFSRKPLRNSPRRLAVFIGQAQQAVAKIRMPLFPTDLDFSDPAKGLS
jgi:hypothetical protein